MEGGRLTAARVLACVLASGCGEGEPSGEAEIPATVAACDVRAPGCGTLLARAAAEVAGLPLDERVRVEAVARPTAPEPAFERTFWDLVPEAPDLFGAADRPPAALDPSLAEGPLVEPLGTVIDDRAHDRLRFWYPDAAEGDARLSARLRLGLMAGVLETLRGGHALDEPSPWPAFRDARGALRVAVAQYVLAVVERRAGGGTPPAEADRERALDGDWTPGRSPYIDLLRADAWAYVQDAARGLEDPDDAAALVATLDDPTLCARHLAPAAGGDCVVLELPFHDAPVGAFSVLGAAQSPPQALEAQLHHLALRAGAAEADRAALLALAARVRGHVGRAWFAGDGGRVVRTDLFRFEAAAPAADFAARLDALAAAVLSAERSIAATASGDVLVVQGSPGVDLAPFVADLERAREARP